MAAISAAAASLAFSLALFFASRRSQPLETKLMGLSLLQDGRGSIQTCTLPRLDRSYGDFIYLDHPFVDYSCEGIVIATDVDAEYMYNQICIERGWDII